MNRLLICVCLVTATGCFGSPGTIGVQRSRAVLHDPFPSNELGPPIVGGRPLGFDRPESEPENLQKYAPQTLLQSGVAAPGMAPTPLPPVQPRY